LDNLISYTKAVVWTLLRKWEATEEELEEIAKEYNISDEFINKLQKRKESSIKMNARPLIRAAREWKEEWEEAFWNVLPQEFDLTFFRKAVNDIRFWLEVMTRAEQEELIEKLRKEWYKEKRKSWKIIFKKRGNQINIKNNKWEEEAKKLRYVIWIDKLKQKLKEARDSWNKEIIEEEFEVAQKVIEWIYSNFNYHRDENDNWYQPKKILETKQIYCVWFSIIWHSILNELWIRHNWLNIPKHSALEVIIWNKKYLFDAANYSRLLEFKEWWKKVWTYTRRKLVWENYIDLYSSWNVEKVLLSQVCTNRWSGSWEYTKDTDIVEKAIMLNPNSALAYYNKWFILYYWKMGELYIFAGNLLSWKKNYFDILYRKEKKEIRKFIKKKDYEGLRLYLLGLEENN
jgi:hypothetical protein